MEVPALLAGMLLLAAPVVFDCRAHVMPPMTCAINNGSYGKVHFSSDGTKNGSGANSPSCIQMAKASVEASTSFSAFLNAGSMVLKPP